MNLIFSLRLKFLLCVFLLSELSFGQLQSGFIIDTVKCSTGNEQSYALYLPSYYSPAKKYPIVYFFDPAARGRLPVELYHHVAEELGYILVCSNNSKNGSWDIGLNAAEAVLNDSGKKFSLDESRLILSGFSGGSRLAHYIAVISGNFYGVIGVGATQAPMIDQNVLKKQNFKYVGLVGNQDMNYQEHKIFSENLNKVDVSNLLVISSQDHQWAPASDFKLALMWLEGLESHAVEIGNIFDEKYMKSKDSIALNDWRLMDSQLQLKKLNFDEKLTKFIKKRDTKIRDKESEIKLQISDSLKVAYSLSENSKTLENVKRKLLTIQNRAKTVKDLEDRKMYLRILNHFFATGYESAIESMIIENYDLAIIGFEVMGAASINPRPSLFYLAKVYALKGEDTECLYYLEKLVAQGFKRVELLNDVAFERVRSTEKFASITNGISFND